MSIQVSVEKINSLQSMEIIRDEAVRERFIDIYSQLWGASDAAGIYEREAIHFNRIMRDNNTLRECTKVSVFMAFIDLAVCGLSLEPGVRAQAYLMPRSCKTGQVVNGKDVYEKRMALAVSGYGELVARQRAGQILHADNPVIVYEGDDFKFYDRGGVKTVEYGMNINHNTEKIVACYMRITRADGSLDYAVMMPEDWKRLQVYSGKANAYYDNDKRARVEKPNALYFSGVSGGIDSGFLVAKCIKHAFKTYPKVRYGRNTVMEADVIDEQPTDMDIYGADMEGQDAAETPTETSFVAPPDNNAGVTVASDDDAF